MSEDEYILARPFVSLPILQDYLKSSAFREAEPPPRRTSPFLIVLLLLACGAMGFIGTLVAHWYIAEQHAPRTAGIITVSTATSTFNGVGLALPADSPAAPTSVPPPELVRFLSESRRLNSAMELGLTAADLAKELPEIAASADEAMRASADPKINEVIPVYVGILKDTLWLWRLKELAADRFGLIPIPREGGRISFAIYGSQIPDYLRNRNLDDFEGFLKKYDLEKMLVKDANIRMGEGFDAKDAVNQMLTRAVVAFTLLDAMAPAQASR